MIIDDYAWYLSVGWMLGAVAMVPGIVMDWTMEIIGTTFDKIFCDDN